jgi:hypothetical protein
MSQKTFSVINEHGIVTDGFYIIGISVYRNGHNVLGIETLLRMLASGKLHVC